MTNPQQEQVLILYGSQTGNSESTAHEIASLLPSKIKPTATKEITTKVLTLDDFLEFHHAQFTRLIIIVVSSYGVGQAPLGARKFREVCDEILERKGIILPSVLNEFESRNVPSEAKNDNGNNGSSKNTPDDVNDEEHKWQNWKPLQGINFAILGLGDSHYKTFFRNPTVIHETLLSMGATRVGELGKADASGVGEEEQSKVIDRWVEGVWDDLAGVLNATGENEKQEGSKMEVRLATAKEEVWKVCLEVNEEWRPQVVGSLKVMWASLGGIFLGLLSYWILNVMMK